MPDLGSLIDAQADIVAGWQERAVKATHAPAAAEIGKALAVAIDKYATLVGLPVDGPAPAEWVMTYAQVLEWRCLFLRRTYDGVGAPEGDEQYALRRMKAAAIALPAMAADERERLAKYPMRPDRCDP